MLLIVIKQYLNDTAKFIGGKLDTVNGPYNCSISSPIVYLLIIPYMTTLIKGDTNDWKETPIIVTL